MPKRKPSRKPSRKSVGGAVLKGANRATAKGRVYWYAWRGGPLIWSGLAAEEDSALYEIARAYLDAVDPTPAQGTVAAVVDAFEASDTWARYTPGTRETWRPHLDTIRDRLGNLGVDGLVEAGPDVLDIHAEIAARAPRAADTFLQVLSRVCSWARAPARRLLPAGCDPTDGIERAYRPARQVVPSLAEIRRDETDLRSSGFGHLADAIVFILNTGLRRGDAVAIDWSAVDAEHGRILWNPSKSARSGRLVSIPVGPDLAALLSRLAREPGPILRNRGGEPWTGDGLSSSLWKAVRQVATAKGREPPAWSLHDLRRACATHLASQGWSSRQIARVLGWSESLAETLAATYVDETAPISKPTAKPGQGDADGDEKKPK